MQKKVTGLLDDGSLRDSVTGRIIQKFYGGLPENLNTINTGSTEICGKASSLINCPKNNFCLRLTQ
jgi:hypothetical protein